MGEIKGKISVIIPTLNEEMEIGNTMAALSEDKGIEVIVVDGGSTDDTVHVAHGAGARVFRSQGPRSIQMNEAVNMSQGEALLFLHADTRLPKSFSNSVREVLEDKKVVGGAFKLGIDDAGFGLKTISFFANLRSKLMKLPYGDQALFVRKDVFHSLGGFRSLAIMEDFDFVRRLRKKGKLKILNNKVMTSARRWKSKGLIFTTILNQVMVVLYLLGVSPKKLAEIYRK